MKSSRIDFVPVSRERGLKHVEANLFLYNEYIFFVIFTNRAVHFYY